MARALLPGRAAALAAWVPPVNVPFWVARLVLRRFSGLLKARGGLASQEGGGA